MSNNNKENENKNIKKENNNNEQIKDNKEGIIKSIGGTKNEKVNFISKTIPEKILN